MKDTYKNLLGIIEINENIKNNCVESLKQIEDFLLSQGPQEYKNCTSYIDADCIHGSRKEMHAEDFKKLLDEAEQLRHMIELQQGILKGAYETKNKVDISLKDLKGIEHDVAYLKLVEGFSIHEIASTLHISESYAMKLSAKI